MCIRDREARPGSSETGVDGRRAGEFTLAREMWLSHRYILARHITGEVRGPEVAEMIMAMESGSGSMSTTHAAVSYTHLDVYKRQRGSRPPACRPPRPNQWRPR